MALEAVIDTNVLVSGLLKTGTPPGDVVDMVLARQIVPVFDDRIMAEYRRVLSRPAFAFSVQMVNDLLNAVECAGQQVSAPRCHVTLPDEHDRCFYECTRCAGSHLLITGNRKHFPISVCKEIMVVSPAEAVGLFTR